MIIEFNPNGSITVSDVVDGWLESRTYYGYTFEEAIDKFDNDLNLKECGQD